MGQGVSGVRLFEWLEGSKTWKSQFYSFDLSFRNACEWAFYIHKVSPFPHSSLAPPPPFPFNFYCWAGKRTLEYWNKSSGQLFKLNFMLYRGIFFLFTRPCRDFILPDPGLHILGSAVFLFMLPNVYVAWKSNFVVKGSNQINFILKLV